MEAECTRQGRMKKQKWLVHLQMKNTSRSYIINHAIGKYMQLENTCNLDTKLMAMVVVANIFGAVGTNIQKISFVVKTIIHSCI